MPENHSARGRLDSWKEIADYLKRDVRTAIRWGKERGLPVHRVPGGKRQAVFAYPHEIDAWLGSQKDASSVLADDDSGQNGKQGAEPIPAQGAFHARTQNGDRGGAAKDAGMPGSGPALRDLENRKAPATAAVSLSPGAEGKAATWRPFKGTQRKVAAGIVLMLAVAWAVLVTRPSASASLRPVKIHKLTDDGHPKVGLRTDGKTIYFIQAEGARGVLMSMPAAGGPTRPLLTPFPNVTLHDLSTDGKSLLMSTEEGIMIDGPLWEISALGGTPNRVSENSCVDAQWSPDKNKIACSGRTAITLMNADGSHAHAIAPFTASPGKLLWSPDGTRLRFNVEESGPYAHSTWEIDVKPDGTTTQPQRLPMGPGCCIDWAWTRDGKRFVYIEGDSSNNSHLMVQGESSGQAKELPVDIGTISSLTPAALPDTLYVTITGTPRGEVLKLDRKQGTSQTFLPGLSATFVSFSPDGQWITYTDMEGASFWRSRADGTEPLLLAKAPWEVELSSWSPDGKRVAFMGRTPGKPWRIYLVGRDGGPIEQASEGEDNQGAPSWSPDGNHLVYGNVVCEKTENCWIRRLNLATRTAEIVHGSNGMRTARWSPDGKYIAALRVHAHELLIFDRRTEQWRTLAGSVNGDNISWSSNSQFVYVDNPRDKKAVVERIRIRDGQRVPVVSLGPLEKITGQLGPWFGLTPDGSLILSHLLSTSEIYELKWTNR